MKMRETKNHRKINRKLISRGKKERKNTKKRWIRTSREKDKSKEPKEKYKTK